MPYLLNLLYCSVLIFLSPWLLYKALTTGKYRRGLWHKLTGRAFRRKGNAPCIWFHGVSVGEIHLLQHVVAAFRRRHLNWHCVISTTTDTGFAEAEKRFPGCPVFWWPFDFTWAVKRALRRVRPDVIVLAEGELWPNFLTCAKRQAMRVAVVNGRMSPRSLARYQKLSGLARRVWGKLDLVAAQTADYARNFEALGARTVHVTGSVKYDGANGDRNNPRTRQFRELFGVQSNDLILVAGSTQDPEERIVLDIYRRAAAVHPNLRLFLVPRQQDRFEPVAGLLQRSGLPFVRRSTISGPRTDSRGIVLVDTIGELGALWGLADVAFVGGSLDGQRGGQNMIEPAAYGAAVVFGPHVWNFKEIAGRLLENGAAVQVKNAEELEKEIERLLADAKARDEMGAAGRDLVHSQQGATERTLVLLDELIAPSSGKAKAA
ncbi:MAG TPA: 3-deoxy-D-manno-octulosonic acid transferase [Gemmataceae bacterium]|nr:3-deoxy-D-manno-octulosonic acid transferase [Gemmataceae bacterium]